jgi:hypothetical protein
VIESPVARAMVISDERIWPWPHPNEEHIIIIMMEFVFLMLHMCESTFNMHSTTSFPRIQLHAVQYCNASRWKWIITADR